MSIVTLLVAGLTVSIVVFLVFAAFVHSIVTEEEDYYSDDEGWQ